MTNPPLSFSPDSFEWYLNVPDPGGGAVLAYMPDFPDESNSIEFNITVPPGTAGWQYFDFVINGSYNIQFGAGSPPTSAYVTIRFGEGDTGYGAFPAGFDVNFYFDPSNVETLTIDGETGTTYGNSGDYTVTVTAGLLANGEDSEISYCGGVMPYFVAIYATPVPNSDPGPQSWVGTFSITSMTATPTTTLLPTYWAVNEELEYDYPDDFTCAAWPAQNQIIHVGMCDTVSNPQTNSPSWIQDLTLYNDGEFSDGDLRVVLAFTILANNAPGGAKRCATITVDSEILGPGALVLTLCQDWCGSPTGISVWNFARPTGAYHRAWGSSYYRSNYAVPVPRWAVDGVGIPIGENGLCTRMVVTPDNIIEVVALQDYGSIERGVSYDDGWTFSDEGPIFLGADHCDICIDRQGTILRTATISGALQGIIQGRGDDPPTYYTMPFTVPGLTLEDDWYHIAPSFGPSARHWLHYLPAGDSDTVLAVSGDGGQTFTTVDGASITGTHPTVLEDRAGNLIIAAFVVDTSLGTTGGEQALGYIYGSILRAGETSWSDSWQFVDTASNPIIVIDEPFSLCHLYEKSDRICLASQSKICGVLDWVSSDLGMTWKDPTNTSIDGQVDIPAEPPFPYPNQLGGTGSGAYDNLAYQFSIPGADFSVMWFTVTATWAGADSCTFDWSVYTLTATYSGSTGVASVDTPHDTGSPYLDYVNSEESSTATFHLYDETGGYPAGIQITKVVLHLIGNHTC